MKISILETIVTSIANISSKNLSKLRESIVNSFSEQRVQNSKPTWFMMRLLEGLGLVMKITRTVLSGKTVVSCVL